MLLLPRLLPRVKKLVSLQLLIVYIVVNPYHRYTTRNVPGIDGFHPLICTAAQLSAVAVAQLAVSAVVELPSTVCSSRNHVAQTIALHEHILSNRSF